ncbi:MAG: NAD(P)/FAD-dependent oxidoreductase [Clostridia bacterium]|nr:NAD(P)/FAD-dependent oxidoreductase [Clostridia bacterium]
MTDLIIIGAGVVGCAVAREMSRYNLEIRVLERGHDVAEGASKANSGIVHAGYDAVPGTLKAKLNVEGAKMYPEMCRELGVPYRKNGALVLAFSEDDRGTLQKLLQQGIDNGVEELRIIEKEELRSLEPNVSEDAVCALLVPTSGITSPYEMAFALADHAAVNGVAFEMNTKVEHMAWDGDHWVLETNRGRTEARMVINCAGFDSARLHDEISSRKLHITHRRGQYYILDHPDVLPFDRTMFQCPTRMGKGILVAPTVHGNVLLGPTAEDLDDGLDTETTQEGLDAILKACRLTWPKVSVRTAVTNFSGIRAHEAGGDFVIGPVEGAGKAWEAAGLESPGLSAAPAVGKMLAEMVAASEHLEKKAEFRAPIPRPRPFNEMTREEQKAAIEKDPKMGVVICRCEVVTEAEIRAAIRRPVGATSVDGVKRRTRAGMGRCQGGFCSPRVVEILSEELGKPMTEIQKGSEGSWLLCGTISEAMGGQEA